VRLDEPSVALVAEAVEGPAAAGWATLAGELTQVFPGTVTDARRTFTALVPIRSEQWAALLEEATGRALAASSSVAGYSDSTGQSGDHALALRQAWMACAVARSSGPARRVRSYASLGAQRYLWAMSQERDPDSLELALTQLRELDRRRGSELFRTLEAYLGRQGNARQAAATLYVHRNTLRQRLRRIREVIDLDPADPASWFELELAVRLIRFRELLPGTSGGPAGTNPGARLPGEA
jgi:DNA-binding PucR family transcriptional regulator